MKIVDLFCGCGGFSHGFKLAGFDTVLAVEKDLWAAETYAFNNPGVRMSVEDISGIADVKGLCGPGRVEGVIGGPPCQGFSLSGNRDSKDPRNSLFVDFVRFVGVLKPDFFVMENVLGILSMKTKGRALVKDIIVSEFRRIGFKVCIHILNAAEYGVPQSRQRVFFFGVRADHPLSPRRLRPAPLAAAPRTVEQAISDLPRLKAGEGGEVQPYPGEPSNDYQRWARTGSPAVHNHVAMRHTKRLVERFASISHGQSVAHVSKEHSQRKRGDASVVSGKVFSQNNMRPYPDKPCPTVAASFQSNFIHPFEDRNFTAREGARLQSFPDTYVFKGKRTTMSWEKHLSQYQQIGNAVPPLLAEAIARQAAWYFQNISRMRDEDESGGTLPNCR